MSRPDKLQHQFDTTQSGKQATDTLLRWVGFGSQGNGCISKKRVNLVLPATQDLSPFLQGGNGSNKKIKMMSKMLNLFNAMHYLRSLE